MTSGRKRGFDLYGLCPYNTVTGSENDHPKTKQEDLNMLFHPGGSRSRMC